MAIDMLFPRLLAVLVLAQNPVSPVPLPSGARVTGTTEPLASDAGGFEVPRLSGTWPFATKHVEAAIAAQRSQAGQIARACVAQAAPAMARVEGRVELRFVSPRLVAVGWVATTECGGAHPGCESGETTFDPTTGTPVDLFQLFDVVEDQKPSPRFSSAVRAHRATLGSFAKGHDDRLSLVPEALRLRAAGLEVSYGACPGLPSTCCQETLVLPAKVAKTLLRKGAASPW